MEVYPTLAKSSAPNSLIVGVIMCLLAVVGVSCRFKKDEHVNGKRTDDTEGRRETCRDIEDRRLQVDGLLLGEYGERGAGEPG